jgi:hypothetical protein
MLEQDYPILHDFMQNRITDSITRRREEGIQAIVAAVHDSVPTTRELFETADDRNRKKHRDRFLKAVKTTYDKHFPRPHGGPAPDLIYRHEAAEQKNLGATWAAISTKKSIEHADDDKARKAVERDRVVLTGACVWLMENCAPGSNAPLDVQAEYKRLTEAVQGLGVPPAR